MLQFSKVFSDNYQNAHSHVIYILNSSSTNFLHKILETFKKWSSVLFGILSPFCMKQNLFFFLGQIIRQYKHLKLYQFLITLLGYFPVFVTTRFEHLIIPTLLIGQSFSITLLNSDQPRVIGSGWFIVSFQLPGVPQILLRCIWFLWITADSILF